MHASEHAEIKYIIYKLDDPAKPTSIVVAKTSESQDYDDFVGELSDTECCFAVYDFQFDKGEGIRNKICFYIWSVSRNWLVAHAGELRHETAD